MKRAITFYAVTGISLLLLCQQSGQAGQIIQNQRSGSGQILYASPVGQTFTAEDAHILSIGFWVADYGTGPINFDLAVELFEGVGTAGLSLGASPVTGLTPGFKGFFDADFSSVNLAVGEVYTAIISSTSERGDVGAFNWAYTDGTPFAPDPYTGGDAIIGGNIDHRFDLTFRVIPEPATLLLLGLGGLFLRRRS